MRRRRRAIFVSIAVSISCLTAVLYTVDDDDEKLVYPRSTSKKKGDAIQNLDLHPEDYFPSPVSSYDDVTKLINKNKVSTLTPKVGQLKVILLTYMRSGSSLTGDIVQQHRGVFYVFEPLWSTERAYKGLVQESAYRLLNGTKLSIPRTFQELTNRFNQVLSSFLNCRLEDVDVPTLTQYFMEFSRSTVEFVKCATNKTNTTSIKLCLQPLTTSCLKSQVILLKVIRTSFQNITHIFKSDAYIKAIHLIRDPRATLLSQLNVRNFKWRELRETARNFCQRILQDLELSAKLTSQNPNRILTIRYEDIAEYPLAMTRIMYKFLHLKVSPIIDNYILNNTYGGFQDGCFYCTNRRNATQTANRWRKKIPFIMALEVQKECRDVLDIMGYRRFLFREDLRNVGQRSYDKYAVGRWSEDALVTSA